MRWNPSLVNDSCVHVSPATSRQIITFRTNLLVDVKLAEDLSGVQKMGVVKNPASRQLTFTLQRIAPCHAGTDFLMFQARSGRFKIRGTQYPLIKNKKVIKAWTANSGRM